MIMTQGPSNCYRCQSDDVVLDLGRGDQVCRNCGEVINQRVIDESSEWRIYMNDDRGRGESMVRCSYEDKNSILPSYTNFIGGTSIQRSALEKSQLMIEKNSTLKLMLDIDAVKDLADKLDLTPAIKDRACSIYKQAVSEIFSDRVRSKSYHAICPAVIYLACRAEGYGRSLTEISKISCINISLINKCQSQIARELSIQVKLVTPDQLLPRMVSKIHSLHQNLSNIIDFSTSISNVIIAKEFIEQKNPVTIASLSLLYAIVTVQLYQSINRTRHRLKASGLEIDCPSIPPIIQNLMKMNLETVTMELFLQHVEVSEPVMKALYTRLIPYVLEIIPFSDLLSSLWRRYHQKNDSNHASFHLSDVYPHFNCIFDRRGKTIRNKHIDSQCSGAVTRRTNEASVLKETVDSSEKKRNICSSINDHPSHSNDDHNDSDTSSSKKIRLN